MDVDPYGISLNARANLHFYEGRFDPSVELFRSCVAIMDMPGSRFMLAWALAGARRFEAALTVLESIGPTSGLDVFVPLCRFWKLALEGKKEKVPELLSTEFLATTRRDPMCSLWVAEGYAMLDQREQALDWLENAVNRSFINYPYLSEYDPFLVKLRSDPRFQKLMVRVKAEWERFEP